MISTDSTFTIGVFILLMLALWLSLSQVAIVVSGYLIASSIGQIPAGIFADKYWYKTSLIIWSLFLLVGVSIFAFAYGLLWFAIGYALIWFGSAMKQGADHALLYEWLKADKQEKSFKKVVWKLDLYTNIFWVLTSIVGGLMYVWGTRIPFYAEIVLVAVSLVIIISIKQPKVKKKDSHILEHIKSSIKQAFTTPKFSKIFIFSALIGSVALTTFQYIQPLLKSLDVNPSYFGVVAAGAFIFRWLWAWSATKIGKIFAIGKYMVLHAMIFWLFLVLIQQKYELLVILPIIAIFYYLRGLYMPTVSTYINDKVNSDNRATMLSINSQLLTLVSAISLFFAGMIADRYGLSATFFMISIMSIVFSIIYVLALKKIDVD